VLRSKLNDSYDVVVWDAGVNDAPSNPSLLARDLASVGSLVGDRCLVIATVSRPPVGGVGPEGLNKAIRSFADSHSNVQLVDWRAFAVENKGLISRDGVHPKPSGYQARATLFAQAVDSCGNGGSGGGNEPSAPSGNGGGADELPALPPASPSQTKQERARSKRAAKRQRQRRRQARARKRELPPLPPPGESLQLIESITFNSPSAKLAGEVLTPKDDSGEHAGVVLIPGDGSTATRDNYRDAASALADAGIVALIYDRRGSGESTGDPKTDYAELADDASTAVGVLRRRSDVSDGAVGIWGFGQGASVAPVVAAKDPKIAAVALASPAALPGASQRDWETRRRLVASGARHGTHAATTYYAVEAGSDDADLGFDPAPEWRKVAQPVLAMWGGSDRVMPVRSNAVALAGALAGGVNKDRTFQTIEGATHELGVDTTGNALGTAPGFLEGAVPWLQEHLAATKPPPKVDTPLPPPSPPPAKRVDAGALDHWPVQLAWLLLPAFALVPLLARGVAHHFRNEDAELQLRRRWLPAVVLALDAVALFAVAYAVADLVGNRGRGVSTSGGIPVTVLGAGVVVALAAVATGALAWRSWRRPTVPIVSLVWLLLAAYWLI
jgi:alpha-beta hydrolase superfamily lysophospholipase